MKNCMHKQRTSGEDNSQCMGHTVWHPSNMCFCCWRYPARCQIGYNNWLVHHGGPRSVLECSGVHKLCPRMNSTYFGFIWTYSAISASSPNKVFFWFSWWTTGYGTRKGRAMPIRWREPYIQHLRGTADSPSTGVSRSNLFYRVCPINLSCLMGHCVDQSLSTMRINFAKSSQQYPSNT